MTGKADFTEEEWKSVSEGPTSAGLIVASASRGGSFRESFSMAKAYAEARQEHGGSQLLDVRCELLGPGGFRHHCGRSGNTSACGTSAAPSVADARPQATGD